ncbi:hypothetical protein Droror1_Dr00027738 [Drosera rotundifolia]
MVGMRMRRSIGFFNGLLISYCSNLYPKAETYRVCNWCLIEAAGNNDHKKTSNSTNLYPCTARSEGDNKGNHDTRQVDALVKKKKSPVGSPSGGLKQKTTTMVAGNCGKGDGMMRMLRRTQSDVAAKSDGMANTIVAKRVFRGKVRRSCRQSLRFNSPQERSIPAVETHSSTTASERVSLSLRQKLLRRPRTASIPSAVPKTGFEDHPHPDRS